MSTFALAQLNQELAMVRGLGVHGADVCTGATTVEVRKARMRAAIAKVGANQVLGRGKSGQLITFAEAFRRVYGEPFESNREIP